MSAISTQLKEFSEDFYDALIRKENTCYRSNRVEDPEQVYAPFFSQLNNAILGYFDDDIDQGALVDFIDAIYAFLSINIQFEYRDDLREQLPAGTVFTMGGVYGQVVDLPDDFYDDIQQDPATDEWYSPNIDAAIATLEDPETIEDTNNNLRATAQEIQGAVRNKVSKLMYSEVVRQKDIDAGFVTPPDAPHLIQVESPPDKQGMHSLIFTELGYGSVAELTGNPGLDPYSGEALPEGGDDGGEGGTSDWNELENVPEAFPPKEHGDAAHSESYAKTNQLFSGRYEDLSNVPGRFTPEEHGDAAHSEAYLTDAPADGEEYVRKDNTWAPASAASAGLSEDEVKQIAKRAAIIWG